MSDLNAGASFLTKVTGPVHRKKIHFYFVNYFQKCFTSSPVSFMTGSWECSPKMAPPCSPTGPTLLLRNKIWTEVVTP
jgi:hypothetical protein